MGLVEGVLHDADGKGDVGILQSSASKGGHVDGHQVPAPLVADAGAVLLAQADGQHLHDAAFIFAVEIGVGLDAAHGHDVVAGEGEGVQPDVQAFLGHAHLAGLHSGMDLAAAGLLGDAVVVQDGLLALGGGAAVAAHGRHDIGRGADALELLGEGPQDHHAVGDLTAGGGKAHRAAGLDAVQGTLALESVPYSLGHILNVGIVHPVAHFVKLGDLNILQKVFYNAHFNHPFS